MQTAPPTDHYAPHNGGRHTPLVANYAHTTPLVAPVAIPATTRPAPVADVATAAQPAQHTAVAATSAVTAATPPVRYAETRPSEVVEVLYPTADTPTAVAAPQPAPTRQTATTTTTTKRLDLDMTATRVDSYAAPTPIHITIHPDPDETVAGSTETAVTNSNAIAYLHSVHPALPATASTRQQPQPTHEHRTSEGAATSLNGLWTPLATASTATEQQGRQMQSSPAPVHGDQVYASEAPILPPRPVHGSAVLTNPHDQQYYDNRPRIDRDTTAAASATAAAKHTGFVTTELPIAQGERVVRVEDVSGRGRTVGSTRGGPLVVGETREMGGVDSVQQVQYAGGMAGERVAVASAASQREMPAAQTFTSTTGPEVVMLPGVRTSNTTTSAAQRQMYMQSLDEKTGPAVMQIADASNLQGGLRTPVMVGSATTGPLVVGETHEVGSGEEIREVDDVAMLNRGQRVAVASAAQRAMPSGQVFTSTTGQSIREVDNVSALNNAQRVDLAYRSAAGAMVTTPLPVTSQSESVRHVSNTTHLQSGTPVAVAAMATGPLVMGMTQQAGGVEQLQQVEDVSRLSHAERLALASAPQREMPSSQVFTSTSGPQVVHVANTATSYDASRSVAMGTTYTQRLDDARSASSIVQMDNASAMSGQRVDVGGVAAGPLVVGETRELGSSEQLLQVEDTSRLSHGERVAVASAAQRAMPSGQVFTSTTGPQVVHVANTTTSGYNASQSAAMGAAYTQRLDDERSGASIVQVDGASALSGQRLDVGEVASGPLVVGRTQQVGAVSNVMEVNELRGERLALSNTAAQSTTGTLRSYELSGESQPQIRYIDQAPVHHHAQAVQNVTQTVQHQHAVQQIPVTTEQTSVTRQAVSAQYAASHTRQSMDVRTEAPTFEHRTESVDGGPVQVLHVDAARLAGKERLGSEAFSVAKEQAAMDSMSGGMKGMQLDDSVEQSYRKEEL